jgi:purine nucleosidase
VDTGIDDALALLLALRSPELEVLAVTTVCGNAPVDDVVRNTAAILERSGAREIPPLHRGAEAPLAVPLVTAPEVHGEDGLGGLSPRLRPDRVGPEPGEAADAILRAAARRPGEITLLATGPLTNLALARALNPEVFGRLRCVVAMGGAHRVRGNTTVAAEFNWYVDPKAAEEVLGSGLPVRVIPLDVTAEALLTPGDLDAARERGDRESVDLVTDLTREWIAFHREAEGLPGGILHDPVAVASLLRGSPVRLRSARGVVESGEGYGRGAAFFDLDEGPPLPFLIGEKGAPPAGPAPERGDPVRVPGHPLDLAVELDRIVFRSLFFSRVLGAAAPP